MESDPVSSFLPGVRKKAGWKPALPGGFGVIHISGDMMLHQRPAPATPCYNFSLAPGPQMMHDLGGNDRAVVVRAEGDHAP